MAHENEMLEQGLEQGAEQAQEKEVKRRREQTPEDVEAIKAGLEILKANGVDDKTLTVLENLAPVWNSGDKDAIAAAKEAVIAAFEGSDKLKDFIDGDFQEALKGFNGIAKIMPIANNIKSFYARRQSTKKAATVQVNIGGVLYQVNKAYYESIADKSKEEKRELLLAHEDTQKANNIEEIL